MRPLVLPLVNLGVVASLAFLLFAQGSQRAPRERMDAFRELGGLRTQLDRLAERTGQLELYLWPESYRPPLLSGAKRHRVSRMPAAARADLVARAMDRLQPLAALAGSRPYRLADVVATNGSQLEDGRVDVTKYLATVVLSDPDAPDRERATAFRSYSILNAGEPIPAEVLAMGLELIRTCRDPSARKEAVLACRKQRDTRVAATLVNLLLKDRDVECRRCAAFELTVHREDPLVRRTLEWIAESDPSRAVRNAASSSLAGTVYGRQDGIRRAEPDEAPR